MLTFRHSYVKFHDMGKNERESEPSQTDSPEFNLTHKGLRLLRLFMEDVRRSHAGADLMDLTGLGSGTLYPLLIKFEKHGLLQGRWEDEEPSVLGRPRRKLYSLTAQGVDVAQRVLGELSLPAQMLRPDWGHS